MRFLIAATLVAAGAPAIGQEYPAGRDARLGPMLDEGLASYKTPELMLRLVRSSGTVAGLEPNDSDGYDFMPAELLAARSTDGYYHLGDLDLRLREAGTAEWHGYSTALERHPVHELTPDPGELRRDDLRPTLPADFPLRVTRSWAVVDGKLALRFTLKNPGQRAIEIGALGIPLIFDNVLSGKSLDEAHAVCGFSDPSIARDGGYVQVTRLNGHGPALLVVPDGTTPFEAYNPIAGSRGRANKAALFHDLTPLGLWLTLDSGRFERVTLDQVTNQVEITLAPSDAYTSTALLRVEQPARINGVGKIARTAEFAQVRGAFAVPLGSEPTIVHLSVKIEGASKPAMK
ncbi:MAG: DUF5695 domain-containing protein [Terracidiphilus sp.]